MAKPATDEIVIKRNQSMIDELRDPSTLIKVRYRSAVIAVTAIVGSAAAILRVLRLPVVVFVVAAFATSCASLNTAYREFNVGDGSGALIDIKQRAIVVSEIDEGDGYSRRIVCAEPSPDALSAYAAQFAAEGGSGEIGVAIAAASQEGAAFVGLRTQSIQLLRDAFYRACEGYMSGALSAPQFDILTRRYQRYMVALLGIEQLTGAVRAPTVTLAPEGQAEASQSLAAMRAQIQSIDSQIASKEMDAGAEGLSEEKKATINAEIAELKKDRAAVEKGVQNARGVAAGGALNATVSGVGLIGQRSDQTIEKISETVGDIVRIVLNTDDLNAVCLASLSSGSLKFKSSIAGNSISPMQFGFYTEDEFRELCDEHLDALLKNKIAMRMEREQIVARVLSYIDAAAPTPDEVVNILNALNSIYTEPNTGVSPVAAAPSMNRN